MGYIGRTKKYPAKDNQKQCGHAAYRLEFFGRQIADAADTLQNEHCTVVNSPKYKGPVRSMPQPAENKHNTQIQAGSAGAFLIASQRDIKVVPEPAARVMCQRRRKSVMLTAE